MQYYQKNDREEFLIERLIKVTLMQYAAGFGKSNIIGWSALQLKDIRRGGEYVYDKIIIVVDRLQLRSQIDSKMLNMNIDNRMYVEAHNKKTFKEALASETRLVIVNLQKFGSVRDMLDNEVLKKLSQMRIVFLIDEIHRSNSGGQHEEMISIFDELQSPFDTNEQYSTRSKKKNLIIGFTATPNDHTLARFGEFSGYAESEKLWIPFDSYTMKEAIEDGFILNSLKNIVPVASKMLFDIPDNPLKGFTEKEYKDAQKKQIYENRDRIDAIAKYVVDLLVKDVYRQIRGTGKAMLAVYSIKAAIAYHEAVTKHFNILVQDLKYAKYTDAPIHIVYSDSQDEQSANGLKRFLGYNKDEEGNLVINEDEAEIVRRIFVDYLKGKGAFTLAKDLDAAWIPTVTGGKWQESTILNILKNEKYKGSVILQKYYTPDHLKKGTIRNTGQVDSYYIEDHHPAIIPEEMWNAVQKEMSARAKAKGNLQGKENKYQKRYPLTSMLYCSKCGSTLKRRTWNSKLPCRKIVWQCSNYIKNGKNACPGTRIEDEVVGRLTIKEETNVKEVIKDGKKHYSYSSRSNQAEQHRTIRGTEKEDGSLLPSIDRPIRTVIKL